MSILNYKEEDKVHMREEDAKIFLDELLDYFVASESKLLNIINSNPADEKLKDKVIKIAKAQLNLRKLNPDDMEFVIDLFVKYLLGYYILDEFINDPDISDIKVLNYDHIRLKKLGKRYNANVKFINKEDYIKFVNLIATKNKKNLSDINALQTFTDKTSNKDFILRIDITTPFIASSDVPYLVIRKISRHKYTIEQLKEKGMLDDEIAEYLLKRLETGHGMLFTGAGASGKTTLMNTILENVSHDKSGLVIQENEELFTYPPAIDENGNEILDENGNYVGGHPDMMFKHIVTTNGEGKISYSLASLARHGLLEDIEVFVIGEIKGDEASGFTMASYTGAYCIASVHGQNSEEAINKLADYTKLATGYKFEDCLKMLTGIDTIVFLKKFKVCEISEVHGFNEEEKRLEIERVF